MFPVTVGANAVDTAPVVLSNAATRDLGSPPSAVSGPAMTIWSPTSAIESIRVPVTSGGHEAGISLGSARLLGGGTGS